jgi:hypothetical protein
MGPCKTSKLSDIKRPLQLPEELLQLGSEDSGFEESADLMEMSKLIQRTIRLLKTREPTA